MKKKPCKECPWVVKSQNNKSITDHSKRLGKTHNCHMTKPKDLWDVTETSCQCVGNKKYMDSVG